MDKRIIPILFLTLVNSLGFSLMIPVFPYIIDKFNADPITYGLMMSAYPMFQFIGAPVLGALSDQWGRRPILLISQAGTVVSWIIFAASYFMPNILLWLCSLPVWVILLSRVIDGITGGNNSVAVAYISDITTEEKRTKIFGMQGGVFGLGLLIGPALGGLAGETPIEYLGTVLLALIISVITFLYLYKSLPESLPAPHRDRKMHFRLIDEINFVFKLQKYRHNLHLLNILFMRVCFAFIFAGFMTIIVLYVKKTFQLSPNKLGVLFLLVGGIVILNEVYVAPYLARRFGNFKALCIGLLLMIISLPFISFIHNLLYFIGIMVLLNAGYSVCMPTFRALITRSVEKTRRGDIIGIDESIFALCSAIAPLFGSFVYAKSEGYVYLIFAAILALSFSIFIWRHRHLPVALTT